MLSFCSVQVRTLFFEHIEVRLDDFYTAFRQIHTCIQLKSDQKYKGIQIEPDHDYDQRTYRSIYFVIRAEVIDVK